MSNEIEKTRVGYKSPPTHSRFQPGQSGNPGGRPKQVKSLKAELIEELSESTSVSEDGKKIEITKARAIAKAMVRAASAGNMRAMTALLSLFSRDAVDSNQPDEISAEEHALLDDYVEREVRRRTAESSSKSNPEQ